MEIEASEKSYITGKPLKDLKLPKGAIIGAISRGEQVFVPVGDTVLKTGDKAVVFSLPDNVTKIEKVFS